MHDAPHLNLMRVQSMSQGEAPALALGSHCAGCGRSDGATDLILPPPGCRLISSSGAVSS